MGNLQELLEAQQLISVASSLALTTNFAKCRAAVIERKFLSPFKRVSTKGLAETLILGNSYVNTNNTETQKGSECLSHSTSTRKLH
jgi:hypothetical protein